MSDFSSTIDDTTSWFSRSWLSKSEDKLPKVLLLKYYTYNRGATAQTLSAGGPGLIAPGGTPGKIKWPELGVTELRFGDRLDPAEYRSCTAPAKWHAFFPDFQTWFQRRGSAIKSAGVHLAGSLLAAR